jgi:hypothetical protein
VHLETDHLLNQSLVDTQSESGAELVDSNPRRDESFYLSDVEVETLRRAALYRGLPFDPQRRTYTRSELEPYGMVREGYTRAELRQRGFGPVEVSCFDEAAKSAEELLKVETPFGK